MTAAACSWSTVRDAAEYLGVTCSRVYRLVGLRAIPHARIGRLIMFPRRKLEAWARAQAQESLPVTNAGPP